MSKLKIEYCRHISSTGERLLRLTRNTEGLYGIETILFNGGVDVCVERVFVSPEEMNLFLEMFLDAEKTRIPSPKIS